MNFKILKENLEKALFISNKAISSRPQLPILSHIMIKASKGQLKFYSTNLELGIIYNTPAKIEKEGEIAIPGKLLTEFVNSLRTEKLEFESTGQNLLIKSDKTKATFTLGNTQDFPSFPENGSSIKTLDFEKTKESILRAIFAASNDEGRPVLTGVRTRIENQKLSLASTDGYRLSKEEVNIKEKDNWEAILPAQALLEIVRIAEEVEAREISFSVIEGKNQVLFDLPQTKIFTRLIDGEFPNIEKIIPEGFKTKATIDKEEFLGSVKTTSIFARGAANIIKIKITKKGMLLSANTPQVGEEEDFLEAVVEGEEMEVAFNYRFLIDLLNNFPDKEIIFESEGSLNPGVFRPVSSKANFFHIIMPVRVQN